MHKDLEKILITEEEIHEAAKRLAAQIERDYEGEQNIVLVGLLKGSVQFMSDLLKNIDMDSVYSAYLDSLRWYKELLIA